MAISQASASSAQTKSDATPSVLDSMTLTPGAGTYLVVFSVTYYSLDTTTTGENIRFAIYANASQQQHTIRRGCYESSMAGENYRMTLVSHAIVTVGDGEAIDVRWWADTGWQGSCTNRTLTVVPIGSLGESATATADDSSSSATWTVVNSMTKTPTQGAGTYLLLFSGSHESSDTPGGDERIGFRVYVNASHTGLERTERIIDHEGSFVLTDYNIFIAAKITLGTSEAADIRWSVEGATNTITIHERTLTLVKINTTEATDQGATDNQSATNTSWALIPSMEITTPGAGDYVAFFSSTWETSSVAATRHIDFTFFEGASQDTPSQRRGTIGTSYEATGEDLPMCTTGLVQLGASDDLEVHWQSDDSTSRTIHNRNVVIFAEPQTGLPYKAIRRKKRNVFIAA